YSYVNILYKNPASCETGFFASVRLSALHVDGARTLVRSFRVEFHHVALLEIGEDGAIDQGGRVEEHVVGLFVSHAFRSDEAKALLVVLTSDSTLHRCWIFQWILSKISGKCLSKHDILPLIGSALSLLLK